LLKNLVELFVSALQSGLRYHPCTNQRATAAAMMVLSVVIRRLPAFCAGRGPLSKSHKTLSGKRF
jgi:hypothetical protein